MYSDFYQHVQRLYIISHHTHHYHYHYHYHYCKHSTHYSTNPTEMVVKKYPKLVKRSKLTNLTVRLAKELYFGKRMMYRCTVWVVSEFEALPQEKLKQLKTFVKGLAVPRCISFKVEFENLWNDCIYTSIASTSLQSNMPQYKGWKRFRC